MRVISVGRSGPRKDVQGVSDDQANRGNGADPVEHSARHDAAPRCFRRRTHSERHNRYVVHYSTLSGRVHSRVRQMNGHAVEMYEGAV